VEAVSQGGMSYGWSGGGGRRGLNAVGSGGTVVRTGRLMGGPKRFWIFFNVSKTSSTLKINMGALSCSKNFPILHAESQKYWKQLAQLCWLQIPNKNKVRNPVRGSVFESDKFFKIPS
jgi:hypothetical protein